MGVVYCGVYPVGVYVVVKYTVHVCMYTKKTAIQSHKYTELHVCTHTTTHVYHICIPAQVNSVPGVPCIWFHHNVDKCVAPVLIVIFNVMGVYAAAHVCVDIHANNIHTCIIPLPIHFIREV